MMKSSAISEMVRPPAVAGMFYPGQDAKLREQVYSFLGAATVTVESRPKALIAPHAGYIYSGPIAGSAFVHLSKGKDSIRRVILIGPSHRVAFAGIALSQADYFETPLGWVPVDKATAGCITALPQMRVLERAHEREHALEVELPFLQAMLGDFSLVPLVVGEATGEEVSDAIECLWGGPETLVVISSDLSHYLDYDTAREVDRLTAEAIEELRPENIDADQACGRLPIQGLLHSAKRHHLRAHTVDLRNSGDTAGTRAQVVGYGAFVFTEN
jgi:AmmeMemoRadiSam system protein B